MKERKPVTEESGIQKEWYERADKITLAELPEFMRELSEDYQHDYGTICHAIAASGIAAMKAFDRGPSGGITGFQAGAIMWQVIDKWGAMQDGPKRMLCYRDMLYPQNEDRFKCISQDTADWLKEQAKKELADPNSKTWHPSVLEQLRKISEGHIPFGFRVESRR